MNRLKINLFLSILMALMTVSSCEIFSDEATDKKCKENELDDAITLIISVDYQINRHDNKPTEWHNLMDAYQMDFIGTVRKMDCRDDEAEYRDFVVSCILQTIQADKAPLPVWWMIFSSFLQIRWNM